mmetsp:Transcript_58040/g.173222  ORF Transcript_58040/g.173222 Transcript_58040/m.173222 type:complete len:216 (-) Transcript_58040:52-699(-)
MTPFVGDWNFHGKFSVRRWTSYKQVTLKSVPIHNAIFNLRPVDAIFIPCLTVFLASLLKAQAGKKEQMQWHIYVYIYMASFNRANESIADPLADKDDGGGHLRHRLLPRAHICLVKPKQEVWTLLLRRNVQHRCTGEQGRRSSSVRAKERERERDRAHRDECVDGGGVPVKEMAAGGCFRENYISPDGSHVCASSRWGQFQEIYVKRVERMQMVA